MPTDLKGRRIALIGGAGFIGHNLALVLKNRGAEVSIVDGLQINNFLTFASTDKNNLNQDLYYRITNERLYHLKKAQIPLYVQDARDYHTLTRTLDQIKPQVIIHLAAVAHAGKANKDPYSTFDHSLRTLENSLDEARALKIEQFIYFSSSMVYGNFLTEQVSEDHPLNPIGIYGALKVAGEKMVIAYQQVFDMPYTIIRPSALYGPRCVSRRVGQVFIESALDGNKLRVDGDGKEKLDFTYIDDLIEGICLTLTKPEAKNQIFNLTYGSSRAIADLVDIVKKYFPKIEVESVTRDQLMPVRGTLDIGKAKKLLNFSPAYSIDTGFPKYIDWYQDFMKQKH